MQRKFFLAVTTLAVSVPVWADATPTTVPEPSTLALFASAALAVVLARKFKK